MLEGNIIWMYECRFEFDLNFKTFPKFGVKVWCSNFLWMCICSKVKQLHDLVYKLRVDSSPLQNKIKRHMNLSIQANNPYKLTSDLTNLA